MYVGLHRRSPPRAAAVRLTILVPLRLSFTLSNK